MLKKYFNSLKKGGDNEFSILADYGDLSKYSYDQMSIILIQWNKQLIEGNGYFDSDWECETTRIRIRFNNSNYYFVQIVEEEWKSFKMVFKREVL